MTNFLDPVQPDSKRVRPTATRTTLNPLRLDDRALRAPLLPTRESERSLVITTASDARPFEVAATITIVEFGRGVYVQPT
jgi:hypothetical protein